MAKRSPFLLSTYLTSLTDYDNWGLWKWLYDDKKIPVRAGRYGKAKVNKPSDWTSYQDALDAYEEGHGDGLAFLTRGSPFAALDLDDCILKDGAIAPWAKDLIARAKSYVERTPSGNGLRILGIGDGGGPLNTARKKPVGKLEIFFNANRYITISGDVLYARPLAPLGAILAEIRASAPATVARASVGRPDASEKGSLIDGFREITLETVITRLKHPPILHLMGPPNNQMASHVLWRIECDVRDAAINLGLQDHPHLPLWIAAAAYASKAFDAHCHDMTAEARMRWLERDVANCLRKGGL